ncbi:MAG: helicase-related protein [Sphingopyxis sp.]
MSYFDHPRTTAILGPTNTGKTHYAIERMLAHTSGMIGLPLRLLARELYDRVARMKGAELVALVTGEERIWPETARYIFCTTEAMPRDVKMVDTGVDNEPHDVAFVAIDEVQLATDRERGHIFTSRMLNARGRFETMFLGSANIAPVIRQLVPETNITSRPRFSTLAYSGPEKLANLPPRTVIVAFAADEVYAIAEGLRRISGGAAVVMGALSPRTRNAQVAMFQSGEVDYLVATDAIGMGLNLDADHVIFASLHKFDGVEVRRLTLAEMAQIAGRAGRHQRDGSFGSLSGRSVFSPEDVEAIEEHRFEPLSWAYWREASPSMASVDALIADLEKAPNQPMLRSPPEASDLMALRQMHSDSAAMAMIHSPDQVRRLWDVCSLPDFPNVGAEAHHRMVSHIWSSLSQDKGTIETDWFMGKLNALDTMDGPIEALGERIGAVRSYCYIAQRGDWLAEPTAMAEKARDVEARLSDAMHDALTARFVDRRTAVLMRSLGQNAAAMSVTVDDEDRVTANGQVIGSIDGFSFHPDPSATLSDHKLLIATAQKYLGVELAKRATVLAGSHEGNFTLMAAPDQLPTIMWHGHAVATLVRGKHVLNPRALLSSSLSALDPNVVAAVQSRINSAVDLSIARYLRSLLNVAAKIKDRATPPNERAILTALIDGCGVAARADVRETMKYIDQNGRASIRSFGVWFGYLDLFVSEILKPMPLNWLTGLQAAWCGESPLHQGPSSKVIVPLEDAHGEPMLGFRIVGDMLLRVDAVEKMARHARAAQDGLPSILKKKSKPMITDVLADENAPVEAMAAEAPPMPGAFHIDPELGISMGLSLPRRLALLDHLGLWVVDPPEDVTADTEPGLWWHWGRRPSPDEKPGSKKTRHRSGRSRKPKTIGSGQVQADSDDRGAMPQMSEPPPVNNPFGQLAGMFDNNKAEQD